MSKNYKNKDNYDRWLKEWNSNGRLATKAAHTVGVRPRTARDWAFEIKETEKKSNVCITINAETKEEIDPFNKHIEDTLKSNTTKTAKRFHEEEVETFKNYKTFVITSVQNDTPINEDALLALENYCFIHNAKLIIVPSLYKFSLTHSKFNVDKKYLMFKNVQINNKLKLLSTLNISPSITAPLAGIDNLSMGLSVIVPHPQVERKPLPSLTGSPALMQTTGSISLRDTCYSNTKTGYKAEFHHSYSALVVELGEGNEFFMRCLNFDDDNGFFDIKGYYTKDTFTKLNGVEGIACGDIHVDVLDEELKQMFFIKPDCVLNVLKPSKLILHDLIDFGSGSHHDNSNYLLKAAKHLTGVNDVAKELCRSAQFLEEIKRDDMEVILIPSNHNDHVYKWLTTSNPHYDLQNSVIYHFLCYHMLINIEETKTGPKFPNLIKLFYENWKHGYSLPNINYLNRSQSYKIHDVELSQHGDVAVNGSKGSPAGFARIPSKTIIGHSHSAQIKYGCYQLGTFSYLNLPYANGASTWTQTFVVIYPNGKRQMIDIINGKWHG